MSDRKAPQNLEEFIRQASRELTQDLLSTFDSHLDHLVNKEILEIQDKSED